METWSQFGIELRRLLNFDGRPAFGFIQDGLRFLSDSKVERSLQPAFVLSAEGGYSARSTDWLGACISLKR